jgi:uncharacterized protein
MRTMTDRLPPPVALEYAREVRQRLGGHACQVILFGSRARGDACPDSDYDFIVVIDRWSREWRNLVAEAGDRLLETHDALCAALVYDEAQWGVVQHSPLGWNVEREGVSL